MYYTLRVQHRPLPIAHCPRQRYDVKGCVMSGSHSVVDIRDGVWRHAEDVGVRLDQRAETLWNLITEVSEHYTCMLTHTTI